MSEYINLDEQRRLEALRLASSDSYASSPHADVIKRAQSYYEFLCGVTAAKPAAPIAKTRAKVKK